MNIKWILLTNEANNLDASQGFQHALLLHDKDILSMMNIIMHPKPYLEHQFKFQFFGAYHMCWKEV